MEPKMTESPDPPTVDGRRRIALRDGAVERAESYVPEWDSDESDVGTALLGLFAEMAEDVTERLDRLPEKHRVAFFDALGFDRDPPQPARLPLVFEVAEGLTSNVRISSGTQAVAEPEGDAPEQTFEVPEGEGFEATPARLDSVFSVSPADDAIFEHHGAVGGESETRLFEGENSQEHALYVGHADVFAVTPETEFEVTLSGTGTDVFESLPWEYYGEREVDGEAVERWHPLPLRPRPADDDSELAATDDDSATLRFKLSKTGAFVASTLPVPEGASPAEPAAEEEPPVTALESLWIRCASPATLDDALFEAVVSDVSVSLVESAAGVVPDMLLANDVPLPTDGDTVHPFGEMPLPFDSFFVASDEAFSKRETPVALRFEGVKDGSMTTSGELDYSWEYWNGSGWARLDIEHEETVPGNGSATETIRFVVPDDAGATTVSGHEHHWIRVRVLEDGHVRFEKEYEKNEEGDLVPTGVWEMIHDAVPKFESVSLRYPDPADDSPSAGSKSKAPDHLVSYNNLAYGPDAAPDVASETATLRPFVRLPDARTQTPRETVYLGFDGPLTDGPVQVLFSAADETFPVPFYPRARWEYCESPPTDEWARLSAEDGTEGLVRRGLVGLVFPEATTASERFGRSRHWVRARLVGDQFDVTVLDDTEPVDGTTEDATGLRISTDANGESAVFENDTAQTFELDGYRLVVGDDPGERIDADAIESAIPAGGTLAVPVGDRTGATRLLAPDGTEVPVDVVERKRDGDGPDDGETETRGEPPESRSTASGHPCESLMPSVVATDPQPTTSAPRLRGLYANAGWADSVRTVTGELLGSSDGTPDQTFSFANRPAVDASVWVEESSALSNSERAALKQERPEDVEERTDEDGSVTAFWVRWTRVEDFVGSEPTDRHYRLDRIDGELVFGDGTNGATPPSGEANVRADYRTGGGVAGNVRAGAVAALADAIPYVEGVTNPEPAGGGADAEATTDAVSRAARVLEDRNRAVTRADFERIALSASRELERVRCIPGVDRTNARRPGWVTVLLVPRSAEPNPTPSAAVKEDVEDALRGHAPVPLVETDPGTSRIAVRGPSYVEVGVGTVLVVDDAGARSVAAVERAANDRLTSYLHPLTGGTDGNGWAFGELPCVSDFYALLERVEGVDHVRSLAVTFRGSGGGHTVTDDDRLPAVAADTLVYSGAHEVAATRALTDTATPEEHTT